MKITAAAAIAAIGLAASLGGCETATPYQPLQMGATASGGFSDQRLDQTHYRVTFQGNTLTSRATVEDYLLYRAAELTVSSGFDWFQTADRHTDRDRQTYVDSFGAGPYGAWDPYWRFWGGWGGWGGWGPYGGTGVVSTVQKFQTSAVIDMEHGPKPAGNPQAMDAREVLANLGPRIQRPRR